MSLVALLTLADVMLMGAMTPGPDFVPVVRNSLRAGTFLGGLGARITTQR